MSPLHRIKVSNPVFFSAFFGIIGFLISYYYFYPGFMSMDSLMQYNQAISNQYGDWHPPIMSWFWRGWLKVFFGPSGMLLMQLLGFWASLSIFLACFFENRPTLQL